MKLLIASDLHGSAYYTRRLIEVAKAEAPDLIALLGDIYNHGPRNPLPAEYRPMEVAEMLNGIAARLVVIKGNCDSEVDAMISRFPLVEEAVLWVDGHRFMLTHGHRYNADNMPPMQAGDTLVYGHFHTVTETVIDGVRVWNPGSISLPKDGHHAYILVEDGLARCLDLDDGLLWQVDLRTSKI